MKMQKIDIIKEAKKHGLKMEWSDWDICSRIENRIIMNVNLPKYDSFCKTILDHEFRHSGKFTKKDFFMDLMEGNPVNTLRFCLRHPKAFSRFIPLSYHKGELEIDLNTLIIYGIILILITILIYL